MSYGIYFETILNKHTQIYEKVLTIDRMPTGALASLVSLINSPRVSEFKINNSPYNCPCKYVINNDDFSNYLTENDIPFLFSFLHSNGYTIDTNLTQMLLKSKIQTPDKKLICMFSNI